MTNPGKSEEFKLSEFIPFNYAKSSNPAKLFWNLIFILFVSIGSLSFLKSSFNRIANKATCKIEKYYEYGIDSVMTNSSSYIDEGQRKSLLLKVKQLQKKKKLYQHLFITFGKNNYALLSLFPILSIITAILGFFVAQVGWGQSDHHLRAYFLIFTALTTLVGVFPNVYNQEEAMDRNIEKYNAIVQLQDDVFHYSQTAPFLYGDSIGVHALIDTINSVESRLGGIQFKVNKVNSGESLEDKLKMPGR